MRIAIVGTELCAVDENGGGLEQVLRRWAGSLGARHEVFVVSHPRPRAAARYHGGENRVEAHAGEQLFELVTLGATTELARALAAIGPDVVSLHNRPQWWPSCPPRAAVAVTFHNYPVAWRVRRPSPAAVRRVAPALALSAVSGALAAAAARWLGVAAATVVVTPPSIDHAYLEPRPRHRAPTVLSPNRLLRRKGVLDLIAVASQPRFAATTFAFSDLTSPWRRPTVEHRELRAAVRAAPNAVLLAPMGPAELAGRYASSGVVACAVREPEGLGLVALEAQAVGAALVTTDHGGLREATFAPNRCVPGGDAAALAAALDAALDAGSRAVAAPVVERCRQLVAARHAPEASAALYEAWLDAAVLRGPPARR